MSAADDKKARVLVTAAELQALRSDPERFEAALDHILATCTDAATISFWLAVKEFARQSSKS